MFEDAWIRPSTECQQTPYDVRAVSAPAPTGAQVVAHPDIWLRKHSRRDNGEFRYSGIPFTREELQELGAAFIYSTEPVQLSEHVYTSGEIPMRNDFENIERAVETLD